MADFSLASCDATAFLLTAQPDASRAFYGDVLGFGLVSEDDFALVFQLHNARLRIARMETVEPRPGTSLGWEVEDVVAAVTWLRERGITFERYDGMGQDELGIWRVPGAQHGVAWFKDPDGNLLSVSGPV